MAEDAEELEEVVRTNKLDYQIIDKRKPIAKGLKIRFVFVFLHFIT